MKRHPIGAGLSITLTPAPKTAMRHGIIWREAPQTAKRLGYKGAERVGAFWYWPERGEINARIDNRYVGAEET